MKYLLPVILFLVPFTATSQKDYTCSKLQGLEHMNFKNTKLARLADPRLNDYNVGFYFIDLAADNSSTAVAGTVTIKALAEKNNMAEFVIELADELSVSEILVNGATSSFSHENNLIVVNLAAPVSVGQQLEVAITYGGTPPTDQGFFSGISRDFGPYNIPVTWTLSEPFNASDWFPVKQVLTDQADSAYIYITVPDDLMAAASGILKNTVALDDNKVRFEWETRYPMAYYLLSMTIAPFQRYDQQVYLPGIPNPLPIQNFIYADSRVVDDAIPALEVTPDMIVLFSELFGTYPFKDEKYGHAMAPMGGGMEHQTISTMAGFNFTLIAHELLHQWFGDAITCATWQDIWINEGFARYGEYLAIEKLISKEQANGWLANDYNYILTEPGGSVYVPEAEAENPYRIFNFRLTYAKGGALLHMLRYVIGNDDMFFDAMRAYALNFRDGLATGDDFRLFMESYTQIPLIDFFDQWYYGEGYPIYDYTWTQTGNELTINLKQQTSAPEITPFFSTPIPVIIETASGTVGYRLEPNSADQNFTFTVTDDIVSVELDPQNIILKKTGTVTGVDPLENVGFQVYPNPANEALYISLTSGLAYETSLIDIHGRIIRQQRLGSNGIHRMPVSDLPGGMYLLRLRNSKGTWMKKIQISR